MGNALDAVGIEKSAVVVLDHAEGGEVLVGSGDIRVDGGEGHCCIELEKI